MNPLPAAMTSEVDQTKAAADEIVSDMIADLRHDLACGFDPAYVWWCMVTNIVNDPYICEEQVAAAFATTIMRLAALEA